MMPLCPLALAATVLTLSATRLPAPIPARRALLIGCTRYDNLDNRFSLHGPANDVQLLRDVLKRYYAFKENNILTLSEEEGKRRGQGYRPTRSHIEREFLELARKSDHGDEVVILLGGRGSLEPHTKSSVGTRAQSNALEAIFLPADCGRWDGTRVDKAIAHYELRDWCRAICKKGASVWIIIDAGPCATMIPGNEVQRGLPVERLVPREAWRQARRTVQGRGGLDAPVSPFAVEPGLVAITAAQHGEPTVEFLLPQEGNARKPHGLLTYSICKVLVEAAQARLPRTYEDLLRGVLEEYRAGGRKFPTPTIQGKDRGCTVLGELEWPSEAHFHLRTNPEGNWIIDGGALHGLTVGSILDVRPPGNESGAEQPLGSVEISPEGFGPLQARVNPCAYKGMPPSMIAPKDAPCRVVLVNVGSGRLAVAVDDHTDKVINEGTGERESLPEERRRRLRQALEEIAREGESLVEVADTPETAQWLLRLDSLASGKLYLVPASGWLLPPAQGEASVQAALHQLPPLCGPAPDGEGRVPWLQAGLTRIARAHNLLQVSALAQHLGQLQGGPPRRGAVRAEIRLLRDENDSVGQELRPGPRDIRLYDRDLVAFRVSNGAHEAVDVSLLLIDSEFGIENLFPRNAGVYNRLAAGEHLDLLLRASAARTYGLEHLVLIAVHARDRPERAYFGFLAQPNLEQARRDVNALSRDAQDRGFHSPLGRLFRKAVYGEGTKRGLERQDVADYCFHRVTYLLYPNKRPGDSR